MVLARVITLISLLMKGSETLRVLPKPPIWPMTLEQHKLPSFLSPNLKSAYVSTWPYYESGSLKLPISWKSVDSFESITSLNCEPDWRAQSTFSGQPSATHVLYWQLHSRYPVSFSNKWFPWLERLKTPGHRVATFASLLQREASLINL